MMSRRDIVTYRCGRILTMVPGQPPIEDGGIIACFKTKNILAIGPYRELRRELGDNYLDFSEDTVSPSLINAHTHLELSHLAGKIPPGGGFEAWVKNLLSHPLDQLDPEALAKAVAACRMSDVILVADVSSRNPRQVAAACKKASLQLLHFAEPLGFGRGGQPPDIWPASFAACSRAYLYDNAAVAGHALYSTHPATLQAGKAWDRAAGKPFSIHLAEHAGEVELLATGRGAFADFLRARILPEDFKAPGISPVAYADALGLLDGQTLAVHCVHVNDADIRILRERGATVCLCPRSNAYIDVGAAPLAALRAAGVRLCLATDSVASNADLDLWNELRFLLDKSSTCITLLEALAWITANPAKALGVDSRYGSLEPGKRCNFSIVPRDIATLDAAPPKPRAGTV